MKFPTHELCQALQAGLRYQKLMQRSVNQLKDGRTPSGELAREVQFAWELWCERSVEARQALSAFRER
jgi:hypothetical protein